ncbi:hypothetical protein [Amycolatopsis sp. NPDC051372]|uniref:hypothetical protein n=1 Tax=Amycolatopsis sp. NPDC051372 TaxID=3155669 RepID=UPI00342B1676
METARGIDAPAATVAKPLRRLFGGRVGRELGGRRIGHPLHPLAVTVPIGAWACAAPLDPTPGNDAAARRLVVAGAFFTASYLRRRHEPAGGKILGFVDLMVLSAGGALGGHLAYAKGAGVFRWQSPRPQAVDR